MDCSKAHAVTLWCAVLAKAYRGLSQGSLKDALSTRFRIIIQLTLPGCTRLRPMDLSRALALKPDDVRVALGSLQDHGLVTCSVPDGCYELTERGKDEAANYVTELDGFFGLCASALSDEDKRVFAGFVRSVLLVPGGFYSRKQGVDCLDPECGSRYCLLAYAQVFQLFATTVKRSAGFSVTDFRFLLELYPKKRFGEKIHRAKDMVRFLRTGRAYVATASVRLEERGFISRHPDEKDARGVLFKLEPAGFLCVQDTSEDIYAVLVAFYGDACDSRVTLDVLKRLLVAEDAALEHLARQR